MYIFTFLYIKLEIFISALSTTSLEPIFRKIEENEMVEIAENPNQIVNGNSKMKRYLKPEVIEETRRKEQRIYELIAKFPGISAYELHKKTNYTTGTIHSILERLKEKNRIFENEQKSKKLKNRTTKIYQTFPFPEHMEQELTDKDFEQVRFDLQIEPEFQSKIEEYQKLLEGTPIEKDNTTFLALEFEKNTADRLMACVEEHKGTFQDFRDFVTKALIEYYKSLKVKQSGKK